MDVLTLTTIIATISTMTLGILVFTKNVRSQTHKLFGLYCLFVALWSVSTFLSLTVTGKVEMLFWIRLVMALATAQSIAILLFILTFPNQSFTINKKLLILILTAGVITTIICLTPLVFSDIELSSGGDVQKTVVAPGIILFILVTIGSIFSSIILSFKRFNKSLGVERIQFQYIFFSLILMYSGVIFFAFVQPVFLQNPNYVYLASLFTLPFIFFTTYAMLRYRLMDVRVVIRKSIIYAISLIVILSIYTYVAIIFKASIKELLKLNTTWATAILIALIALGFPSLKIFIEKLINKIFKDKKSIDLAVKEVREMISQETHLDKLVGIIGNEMKKYLEINEIKVYLLYRRDKIFMFTNNGNSDSIEPKNDLIQYFEKYRDVLVQAEISHLLLEKRGKFENEKLSKAEKEMKKRKISLAMPLYTEDEIFGIIMLGDRKDTYTIQDVRYLERLREQINSILANALLYKDAMERIEAKG